MEPSVDISPPPDHGVQLGRVPFVIAGISFVPLLGVPFGLVAIVWGLIARRRGGLKVAAIGTVGIAFTVILYGALFYFRFYHRGGVFDDLRGKLARTNPTSLVREIEYYKLQHGRYPGSLEHLKPESGRPTMVLIYDPAPQTRLNTPGHLFYYELTQDGEHYFLRSVGIDGQPFTADDILPDVPEDERTKTGLLLSR